MYFWADVYFLFSFVFWNQYVTQTHFELKTLVLQPSRAGIAGGIIGILATMFVCVSVHVWLCICVSIRPHVSVPSVSF